MTMGITTVLALVGVLETLITDAPQAIATFNTVKAMLVNGTEPTVAQWAALDAALASHHAALQAA
jgi:hypothetical protein